MEFTRAPLALLLAASVSPTALAQSSDARETPTQTLAPVFVTGSPLGSNLFELVDPVNVLAGRDLRLKQQPTIGATLEQEVGVTSTNFGPNASRPIIRGLGGFDIRMLNNGIGLLDASSASPDHAVALSPFAVDRIEVVRGPATVMYGGSAIGGVVNTIDSRIALRPLSAPVGGAASYRYDSQNDLNAGGARIDGGNERFALHADAYATRNNDLKIPGSAWTSEVQAIRGEPGPQGTLPNSQGDSQTYGLGGTAFFDRGYAGISYSQFKTNYGNVAEPNVTIDLKQHAWNFAGELRDTVPGFSALRLKYGYNDYTHTEFEGSEAGTVFDSNGMEPSPRRAAQQARPVRRRDRARNGKGRLFRAGRRGVRTIDHDQEHRRLHLRGDAARGLEVLDGRTDRKREDRRAGIHCRRTAGGFGELHPVERRAWNLLHHQ